MQRLLGICFISTVYSFGSTASKTSSSKYKIYIYQGNLIYFSFTALSKDYATMMSAMQKQVPSRHGRCMDTQDIETPCLCRFDMCIGWYPCGLKYCRGKDTVGKVVSYRCGIKTCKRCLTFYHVVVQKRRCLWDS